MRNCLCPFLMYGNEIMILRKERSRIRALQRENLRGLVGIRRTDKLQNLRIRELCGVTRELMKGLRRVFSGGSAMWRE